MLAKTLRSPALAVFIILLVVSLGATYLMATQGLATGVMIALTIVSIICIATIIVNYRVGFYMVFIMGVFMFYVDRLLNLQFPYGVIYDGLILLTFLALFVKNKENNWSTFRNPVTIMFVIVIVYQLLQLVNPNATSVFGWLVSLRNNTSFLIYVIAFQLFASITDVKRFTSIWLGSALIVALYGISQKVFGLSEMDRAWLYEVPERVKLYINWGELRVFSVMSDPSAYGLFMGMSGLAAMVLTFGPFKAGTKIFCGISMIILFVSMSFSGTRTALAMVAVGIVFYTILMMHNRRTFLAAACLVMFGLVLMFGPFYGGTMSRLRSTFRVGDDPSMAVRDVKRVSFQDYIKSHPIGGGLNSVGNLGNRYSPGHELAGEWEPDSGYLFTALETGWIGLIIFQVFFAIVIISGINHFFAMDDPVLKTYLLAFAVPFFALSVAHYTQDAMFTKPMNVIIYATYALVFKIPQLQRKLFSVELV